jgi:hypothetical protein
MSTVPVRSPVSTARSSPSWRRAGDAHINPPVRALLELLRHALGGDAARIADRGVVPEREPHGALAAHDRRGRERNNECAGGDEQVAAADLPCCLLRHLFPPVLDL